MTVNKNIEFIIDHIDPLGQGVFKKGDDIFFIPKTLPNESGTAEVLKRKKGVHFAKVNSLANESDKRIKPECVHFDSCQGCHFLHCDYQTEISFKEASFKKMLSYLKLDNSEINTVTAENRLNYRNRIQLHYNKDIKKLGFIDGKSNTIVEIPNCLICNAEVTKALKELYSNEKWLNLAPSKPKGHVEIYSTQGGVKVTWNKSYAEGGFTQVNAQMNSKMNDLVESHLKKIEPRSLVDLFGGNGNLSKSLVIKKKIIDIYSTPPSRDHLSINLFEDNALELFKSKCSDEVDTFIIDPPRAGFKHISSWVTNYKPESIIYISCHPQTMIRDFKELQNTGVLSEYTIEKIYLLDLFPSTFHFEAMTILRKK
jgi:23S rRNA (uracil1939-C5)-methyltransferase